MYVYFVRTLATPSMLKIGRACDVARRIAELQTGCPYELELIGSLKCKSARHAQGIEKAAHAMLRRAHSRGEWFTFSSYLHRVVLAILERPADDLRSAAREAFNREKSRESAHEANL